MPNYAINFPSVGRCIPIYECTGENESWLEYSHTEPVDFVKALKWCPDIDQVRYFTHHHMVCLMIFWDDGWYMRKYMYKFEWTELIERCRKKHPQFVDTFSWKEEGF